MAVYNGANYIREQIASILSQLGDNDELIIVDDASLDDTVAIIDSYNDRRIRIVHQEYNRGVVQSFGHALQEAGGEIIFLADQDDVWRTDKVEKFLEIFRAYPDITLLMSDLAIMDAAGNTILESRFKTKKFHPGVLHNLMRNSYQGSTMAFRRSILDYCLPFPCDIPMHDMWIGLVNQFVGKVMFINDPLLFYRRHGSNKSPETHASLMQMIYWRWSLMKNLGRLYVRTLLMRSKVN